jgi:hypothetical protein
LSAAFHLLRRCSIDEELFNGISGFEAPDGSQQRPDAAPALEPCERQKND